MRLSLKAHPMALLRAVFAHERISTCAETAARADGRFTKTAGLVLVRQRPGTGNAIFITLEDETGITNCVLWARQFEALRRPVMAARLMLVEGRVQKSPEGVVHLMASHIIDRSAELDRLWDVRRSAQDSRKSLRVLTDEGATLFSHADPHPEAGQMQVQVKTNSPSLHPESLPKSRHPRNARILPKSRDFH
jgi:error-prone DNA polymerase